MFARVAQIWLLACAVLSLHTSNAYAQTASASMQADRETVGVGERIRLEITAQSQGDRVTSIEPPELDGFQIVGRNEFPQTSVSFGFGSAGMTMVSSNTLRLTLIPQREGRFRIRPARVHIGSRVETTNPITITVTAAPQGGQSQSMPLGGGFAPGKPNGAQAPNDLFDLSNKQQSPFPMPPSGTLDGATYDAEGFLRVVVDKVNPVVGEQVTVTHYLYVRSMLRAAPAILHEPTTDGFWTQSLVPATRSLEAAMQSVGGVPFRVYMLKRVAAFPMREGDLNIGPMSVQISTVSDFDPFGGALGANQSTRESPNVVVHVRALPPPPVNAGEAFVGQLTIEASLDRTEVPTGDAVTLRAIVRGTGNLRTVRLAIAAIDGLDVLAPQTQDTTETSNDVVSGTRTFEWIVIPKRPGDYTIDSLAITTFDPRTNQYTRVQAPALHLGARGQGAASASAQTPESENTDPDASPDEHASFGVLRTASALTRTTPRVADHAWFQAMLVAAPLALGFFFMARSARRRIAQRRGGNANERALRAILSSLQAPSMSAPSREIYASLGKSLRHALELRLDASLGAMTHRELRAHLLARGMPDDLAKRFVEEIEGSEFSQFSAASGDAAEIKQAFTRAHALVERLIAFSPSEAS